MKKKLPALLIILGLACLLYPHIANYINSLFQTRAISEYDDTLARLEQAKLDAMWKEAKQYNKDLVFSETGTSLDEEQKARYLRTLDVSGTGIMGYVEIPRINLKLPIYHGTEDNVLRVASGHLDWTSLPVGGTGEHSVISGHRGLPDAELFTRLSELEIGDSFYIQVLGRTLEYKIDQILSVRPSDIEELKPVAGKDYCTLLTCTPYGINTHRLLLRGTVPDPGFGYVGGHPSINVCKEKYTL